MSIVKIGPFRYPDWNTSRPITGSSNKTEFTINDASDVLSFRLNCPSSGTIEQVWIQAGTITTSGDLVIGLRDHASGTYGPNAHPDTSNTHFASLTVSASQTFFASGPITNDGTASGTRKTVNAGDVMAIDIRRASGSSYNGGILYINSTAAVNEFDDQVPVLTPHIFTSANGGSTYSFATGQLNCAIEFDDGTFMQGPFLNVETYTEIASIGRDTTPDEVGFVIIPESTMEVSGVFTLGNNANTRIRIYDATDTVLAETLTGNHGGTAGRGNLRYHFFSPVTLTASNTYRVTLEYLDPSTAVGIFTFTAATANTLQGVPIGTGCYYTERTNAGAWTDDTTKRPCMGLVITGMDTTLVANRGQAMHRMQSNINGTMSMIA